MPVAGPRVPFREVDAKAFLDEESEEVAESEATRKDQLKSGRAALEAVVGDESRLELIAKDLVEDLVTR